MFAQPRCRRDLADAALRCLDAGPFALETRAPEVAAAITGFLGQGVAATGAARAPAPPVP